MAMTEEQKTAIFNKIKKQLEKCTPPMVASKGNEQGFQLMGNKPVPYGYDKKIIPGMFFSAVAKRKNMVSFHFFPIYMNPSAFKGIAPHLFKTLKGKTISSSSKMFCTLPH